jgi:hypothetical protein
MIVFSQFQKPMITPRRGNFTQGFPIQCVEIDLKIRDSVFGDHCFRHTRDAHEFYSETGRLRRAKLTRIK